VCMCVCVCVCDCTISRKDSDVYGVFPASLMHDLLRPISKAYV